MRECDEVNSVEQELAYCLLLTSYYGSHLTQLTFKHKQFCANVCCTVCNWVYNVVFNTLFCTTGFKETKETEQS